MQHAEENVAPPRETTCWTASAAGPALVIHGGAGGRIREFQNLPEGTFEQALRASYEAGADVLRDGGSALDAVCAAVAVMEDDPLFNAGRGAALTADGRAELDASVMAGGLAGAVAGSRHARHPVLAARAVMERTGHVLIAQPAVETLATWDLETVEPEWFVTPERSAQLERVVARREAANQHGTVGAVARDAQGRLAAATSTGGTCGQWTGRIGDTPVIGAGTYARDGLAAVSCTGHGEAFLRGVVAHDVVARLRYTDADLRGAVLDTIEESLTAHDASGGIIAVGADGSLVVAYNSAMMLAAMPDGADLRLMA